MTTRMPASVETIMSAWPGPAQKAFQQLRALILEIAGDDPKIGTLTETLKWREPAFLTDESGSGTTVRVAWKAKQPRDPIAPGRRLYGASAPPLYCNGADLSFEVTLWRLLILTLKS